VSCLISLENGRAIHRLVAKLAPLPAGFASVMLIDGNEIQHSFSTSATCLQPICSIQNGTQLFLCRQRPLVIRPFCRIWREAAWG